MKELFIQIVNMSITASWLVFVIALIRLVFKKAPKSMICFLWLFVAIRLIVPFSFESALSLIPSTQVIPDEIIEVTPNPSVNVQSPSDGFGNGTQIVIPNQDKNLNVSIPSVEQNVPVQNEIQWMEILPWCWICGILMMVGYAAYSYQKIVRQVQISINKEENIWICDDLSSPFILGVLNPRIYVPSYLSETEMKYVLAHEKAHLKRFDHLWKPLGYTLLSVYWFNPVLWAAYILLCSDIELACDEKVIKTLGDDNKIEYSKTLLSCSVPRNMILACPLAFGEVSVKQRVKSVLNYKKPAFWVLVVALLICIALPVFFLSDPETPISKALNDDVYEYAKTMATGHIETVLGYEPESNYSLHKVQGTEGEFPYIYQVTKDEEPILLVEFEYDTSILYSGFSFDYGEGYLIPKVKDKYFRNYESDEYLYSVELNSEMDYELYQNVTVQHLDYTYHEEAMDKLMDYLSDQNLGYMCSDLEGFELRDGDLVQLGAPVLNYKIALNEENKTIEIIQINHFDYPVYINHELKTVFSIYTDQEEGEAGYGFVPINKYPMLKDEKLIRIQTGTLYLQELLVTEDGIVNDDAVYPLYVDNTMDTLKMLVQGLNDSTANFPLEIRVVNEQSVVVPYELYIQNPQTTHYKNGVLFFKMAPDNPGNKRAFSKMFSVDSVLSLQILREDEWQTVCEYPLKNVDREIKDRQFIEFAVETKDLEYSENGTYRVEIKVIEPEKEYTLVSDVFDLSVHDLSGDPYDVNDFLSLYPFNLYNVDGVFNQSKRDDLLVGTNYTGCAVPVEQEVYHQLAAMSCKVLSKETCAMNSYQYYLPEDDEVVVIRKVLKEGYIDDRYENHLKELIGAEFSEWLENAISTEPILIPSCLSSHEEMEGFVFTVYRDNEEVEYYLQVSEENNGTFLKIQFYDREKIIGVSYQFYPQIIGY